MRLPSGYELNGIQFFKGAGYKIIRVNVDTEFHKFVRALFNHRTLVLMRRVRPGIYVMHRDGVVVHLVDPIVH